MPIKRNGFFTLLVALAICAPMAIAQSSELDARSLLRSGKYQELDEYYTALQQKFDAGKMSGDQLRDAFRAFYPTDRDLVVKYDAWVLAYPRSYVARVARGIYYKKIGLEERGEKYVSETSQSQIDKMDRALQLAEQDLRASFAMDSKPFLSYLNMMDIGKQYLGSDQIRKIFDAGIALDPKSMGLRLKLMSSLEPRWGGSTKEMRAFLEECKKAPLPASDLAQLEAMVYDEEGIAFRAAGNLAAAEQAFRKSLALGPCSCTNVRNDLNNVLFDSHQFDAAIFMLDKYLREDSSDLWALANRGAAKFAADRPQEAIVDFTVAANAGDSFSQNRLGMIYFSGARDVKPDFKQSVYWLRKAAEQGEIQAQTLLPQAEAIANRRDPIH